MNYIDYVSEEIADELEKHYTVNGPKNFPDALCSVFLRTGPTTATLTSVYPSKEAYDRATEQRKKAMKSHEGFGLSLTSRRRSRKGRSRSGP
jgi:hypothetical protein